MKILPAFRLLFSLAFCALTLFLSPTPVNAFFSQSAATHDRHTIHLKLDFESGRIRGSDVIAFSREGSSELSLFMSTDIDPGSIVIHGPREELPFIIRKLISGAFDSTLMELVVDIRGATDTISLSFLSLIPPVKAATERIERGVSFSGIAVMGREGAFLPSSSYWFPRRPDVNAFYDVTVSLPSGYLAVMEGEMLTKEQTAEVTLLRYRTLNPMDGLNLVAGRYAVTTEKYKGIDISTYFYRDDPALSRIYIEKTKQYIDIYEGLLPEYPYKKFVVVENFLPTGFGLPSFTLLGSAVLRLPFIPDTALGHEFAHNWWGNGIFIDPSGGNWSEALTSYTADHLFKERISFALAASYRLKALYSYANYARESAKAVKDYTFDSSVEARALGYGKAMMVFHMLRLQVGDKLFYESLRRFYLDNAFTQASWLDLRTAFEGVYGKKLGWFFDQWLLRAGGPELSIEDIKVSNILSSLSPSAPAYRLSFIISQKPPLYRLKVPILIETETGEFRSEIRLDSLAREVKLEVAGKPLAIEIDPDVSFFRVLPVREPPPSLASLFGDRRSLLVVPGEASKRKKYLPVIKAIQKDYGLSVIEDIEVLKGGAGSAPLFIFGGPGENALFESLSDALSDFVSVEDGMIYLNERGYKFSDTALVAALRLALPGVGLSGEDNGEEPRIVSLFLGGLDGAEMERIAQRIAHLTNKGYLVFSKGGGLESGLFSGEKALRYEITNRSELP